MMHFNDSCSCHKNGLCIDSRHLSWVAAIIVLLFFLFFVAGYFVGKRRALQDVHDTVVQESFSDKIYASLCTMQHNSSLALHDDLYREPDEQECVVQKKDEESVVAHKDLNNALSGAENAQEHCAPEVPVYHYAQLVGFGTREPAQKFVQRLQKQDIPVVVKERFSKTAKGRKITWYQVVTEQFRDRDKLEALVSELQSKEHLRDVRIIKC